MYQSNRSLNIPPRAAPGHLNFWKIFGKFPPHRAEKRFKCPHSRENYHITVSTFQYLLLWFWSCAYKYGFLDNTYLYIININRSLTLSNTEHSLYRPLVFNQSATNTQSFPLNSSKFDVSALSAVSTMIYQSTWTARLEIWNRGYRSNSPPPMSGNQIPSLPGRKRRQMPGVCPGGGMLRLRFHWYINFSNPFNRDVQ